MEQAEVKYAPGMRIIVRGEEWMVKKVETNSLGNQTLYVIGLSQLVKDYESMFLVDVENDIEIVDPAKVTLVPDDSAFFRKSKVYIESQWRSKIPTDNKCLVKYALKELLKDKTADEILHLTVCEPAMGSAAFLNEAINQLAEAYLTKKQEELGETISYDKRFKELQKVKMFIADRNVYGCDLNPVAVELAEVSLWLNTIYKGAYVPWFGTQLVNGNSLIGARRQVYSQSALEAGKWYDKTPRRIMPGEERTKKGQHEHTKEIYHFLLGDPGMANYSDKVIKGLEPEKIKMLKAWNKEFTSKFEEDELKTVLRLSESIDKLWKLTADERKRIEKETYEPLSVYGHDELGEGSHKSIREKDEIYKRLFKSEKAQKTGNLGDKRVNGNL